MSSDSRFLTWATAARSPRVSAPAADQSSVRTTNLGLVLNAVFAAGGGISRAEVASITGLTRATVSRLVTDAIEAGLLVEAEPTAPKMGRPSTPLFPAARTAVGIGLEVNVDHVAGVAIDLTGAVVDSFALEGDFADSDPAPVLTQLAQSSTDLLKRLHAAGVTEIAGISIAIPGVVDVPSGEVVSAPNLGWSGITPADYLREVFPTGTKLVTHNDADLQAMSAQIALTNGGEHLSSFIYISGDTGIGGAVIADGSLLAGERGWAGEIGHVTIDPNGPPCHCGSRGCLETYAGWRAIAESAQTDWKLGAGELLSRLNAGDERAATAIARAGWALGIAIATAVKLLDIRTIVLGTSLSALKDQIMPAIMQELDRRLLAANASDITVLATQRHDYPAANGGAFNALRWKLERPEAVGTPLAFDSEINVK